MGEGISQHAMFTISIFMKNEFTENVTISTVNILAITPYFCHSREIRAELILPVQKRDLLFLPIFINFDTHLGD